MEHYLLVVVNAVCIVGCLLMAIIFLILPLPHNKSLAKYRISLRVLALAYASFAVLKIVTCMLRTCEVDLFSFSTLIISSLQAFLFAFALITLINPLFISRKTISIHLLPVLVFSSLFLIIIAAWGNPPIHSFSQLQTNRLHPSAIIRLFCCGVYLVQLIYLSIIFFQQTAIYTKGINDYFADSSPFQLRGVKKAFYAALSVGLLAFMSMFFTSGLLLTIFGVIYAFFYVAFGLYYIQYPARFFLIEPAIYPTDEMATKQGNFRKKLEWCTFKSQIVENKYYLKPGITIEDMAQYLKIGRTTLSNFINTEEGVNFNVWINSLRVEEAKSLLLTNPEYTLIQIAELLGYSELSNFSRQFKIMTNASPSVWRQTYLTGNSSTDYTLN